MMGRKKSSTRRKEVIRQKSSGRRPGISQRFDRVASPWSFAVVLGLIVVAGAAVLFGGSSMPYRAGQRVDQDILARVPFKVLDPQSTERLRTEARQSTPNVYRLNQSLLGSIESHLNSLLAAAKESGDSYENFDKKATADGWVLDPAQFEALKRFTDESGSRSFGRLTGNLIGQLRREFIVDTITPESRKGSPTLALLVSEGDESREVDAKLLQTADNPTYVGDVARNIVIQFPLALQPIIAERILFSIAPKSGELEPVYRFDSNATRRLIDQNMAAVKDQYDEYDAGAVLAGGLLTDQDIVLLRQEHAAYVAKVHDDPNLWRQFVLGRAGRVGLVILLIAGLTAYTARYQPRISKNPYRALGLAVLVLLVVVPARISAMTGIRPEAVVGVVALVSALITIVYGQRFALYCATVMAWLAMLAIEGNAGQVLTMLAAAWTTVLLLNDIRTRSKLVQVGFAGSLVAFAAATASGLVENQQLRFVINQAAWAAGTTFFASLVIQGVLPFIERIFKIATSMTLLEWTYANRPLLKRLAQEAPGTNNHSLTVATIAEAAADAIGANGLLAKVGAMYHDCGKIHKPDYFTENQDARINRHDGLTPTMSLLIIRGHVKDGIELAKEYGLPRVLVPFIAEHHGTTLVRYFHHRASEQAKASGRHDREISESEFRYPGPKPQSKETAILMICDGVEGLVRSLPEATPMRIEGAVHNIVMDRLNDGQFDECDITLRELHQVEESLVKTLSAIYHGRVSYPKASEPREAPKEASARTA